MRARDLDRLVAMPYDVIVIGGGIHGLTIGYEAASRGLRTAIVEAGDFGGGTSFNHQKTAHGGLRSLQSGRLDRASESIRERRALARIAPWLLRPLPFLVGTYRSVVRSRLALRAAFQIDAWLGRWRNDGLEPELHLPAARLVSKAATLRLFPGIRQERLTGGAQWYDYQMVESDRLTLAFAAAAARAGAELANYVEVTGVDRVNGAVTGVQLADRLDGGSGTIAGRIVVNAAGASVAGVMRMFGVTRDVPMVRAMNLMTSRPARDMALAAPGATGRMLTLVPWKGRALIGTNQSQAPVTSLSTVITTADVDAFIADANAAFPALHLTRDAVTLVHRGIVPADVDAQGRAELRGEPAIFDHTTDGAPGAFSVVGVKYTTARAVAQKTVERIAKVLGKRVPPSQTAVTALPGAAIADHEALAIETASRLGLDLPLPAVRHLTSRYAEAAAAIVRVLREREDLRAPLDAAHPTLAVEVVHAIRHDMAGRLSDIVIRRTGLGAAEYPGDTAVTAAANVAASELGWNAERTAREIEDVRAFYRTADKA